MCRLGRMVTAGAFICLSIMLGCGGGEGGQAAEQPAQAAESGAMAGDQMTDDQMADQQQQQEQESKQDPALIAQGKEIFAGAGLCYACHGNDGEGIPNLGANLTDSEWLHSDGSIEGLAEVIMTGVPAEKSTTGTPMPPKGGSSITDEQVQAVAAFVLSLSASGE